MFNAGTQVPRITSAPASLSAFEMAHPNPLSSATPATNAFFPRRSTFNPAARPSSSPAARAARAPRVARARVPVTALDCRIVVARIFPLRGVVLRPSSAVRRARSRRSRSRVGASRSVARARVESSSPSPSSRGRFIRSGSG